MAATASSSSYGDNPLDVGAYIRCVSLELCDLRGLSLHCGGGTHRAKQITLHTSGRDGQLSVVRVTNRMDEDDGIGVEVFYSSSAPELQTSAVKHNTPPGCTRVVEGSVAGMFDHPHPLSSLSLMEPLRCGVRITDVQQAFANFRIIAEPSQSTPVLGRWACLRSPTLCNIPDDVHDLIASYLPHHVSRLEIHMTAPRFRIDSTSLNESTILGSFTTALSHLNTASTCADSAIFSADAQ